MRIFLRHKNFHDSHDLFLSFCVIDGQKRTTLSPGICLWFCFCAMNNIWIHYLLCQVLFFSIKRLLLLVLHLKFIINFSSLFCYCELWVPFFFVVCAPCVLCAQHRTVISILNRRKCHTNKTDSQFSDKNSIEAEPSEEIIDALFFVFVVVVSLSFLRISSGFVQFCPINCWAFHIYKRISHRQALVSVLASIVTVDNEQSNRV